MIDYASEQRCPFFLICRDTIQIPESERSVIIPVYNCNLVAGGMMPRDRQPQIVYGPDGSPVSLHACTLQRYETVCKSSKGDTVGTAKIGQQIHQEALPLVQ